MAELAQSGQEVRMVLDGCIGEMHDRVVYLLPALS
jgi:hypothetical protein